MKNRINFRNTGGDDRALRASVPIDPLFDNAPRLGRHASRANVDARFLRKDEEPAAHGRTGRRHGRLVSRFRRRPSTPVGSLLSGPRASQHPPAFVLEPSLGRTRKDLHVATGDHGQQVCSLSLVPRGIDRVGRIERLELHPLSSEHDLDSPTKSIHRFH